MIDLLDKLNGENKIDYADYSVLHDALSEYNAYIATGLTPTEIVELAKVREVTGREGKLTWKKQ